MELEGQVLLALENSGFGADLSLLVGFIEIDHHHHHIIITIIIIMLIGLVMLNCACVRRSRRVKPEVER